jgi:hypothetical protein
MKIEFDINTKEIAARMAAYEGDVDKNIDTALYATAQHAVAIILDRTEAGMGVLGIFKPYSASYAKAKKEGWPASARRSAFSGDPSGKVNLNVTGEMTGAMMSVKGRGFAEIKFSNPRASRKAYFNNKTRYFFGLNATEKKRLTTYLKSRLFR